MKYMKQPCKHCPFRNDVKPFLHPDRAAEIAYASQNKYASFACHKTTEYCDDYDEGEMLITSASKECAGFLTLRAQSGEDIPEGFIPAWDICYADEGEMIQAYDEEWSNKTKPPIK